MSSIIKVDTIQKADGNTATVQDLGLATGALSHRNLIINGDMRVSQRNTQVTSVTSGAYRTCDRWYIAPLNLGTWTIDQSTDAPDAFKYSLKLTCTTAEASPDSTDYIFIRQKIERQNVEHLKWGTSDALPLKLSFWVKSNKTGTFGVETQANTSSTTVETSADVTINSADTWEYKTVTIPANTSYALGDSDNGNGISLWFWVNAADVYSGTPHSNWANQDNAGRAGTVTAGIGETVNDYFAITGIQLEVGSVATPFEHRSYGEELARCQRYYYSPNFTDADEGMFGMGYYRSSTQARCLVKFPTTMRVAPTLTAPSGTDYYNFIGIGDDYVDSLNLLNSGLHTAVIRNQSEASGTQGYATSLRGHNASAIIGFDAEL